MTGSPLVLNCHIFFLRGPVAFWLCRTEKTIPGFFVSFVDELAKHRNLIAGRTVFADRRRIASFSSEEKSRSERIVSAMLGTCLVVGCSDSILFCTSDVMEKGSAVNTVHGNSEILRSSEKM